MRPSITATTKIKPDEGAICLLCVLVTLMPFSIEIRRQMQFDTVETFLITRFFSTIDHSVHTAVSVMGAWYDVRFHRIFP